MAPGVHTLTAVLLNNDGSVVENSKTDIIEIQVVAPSVESSPYIELLEPADETVVAPGQEVTVRVDVKNVEFVANGGEPPTAEGIEGENQPFAGHYRVYLGYDEGEEYLATSIESEVKVTLPESLFPGQHQLRVELWEAGGGMFEDPQPENGQSITLVVPGLKKPSVVIESPGMET